MWGRAACGPLATYSSSSVKNSIFFPAGGPLAFMVVAAPAASLSCEPEAWDGGAKRLPPLFESSSLSALSPFFSAAFFFERGVVPPFEPRGVFFSGAAEDAPPVWSFKKLDGLAALLPDLAAADLPIRSVSPILAVGSRAFSADLSGGRSASGIPLDLPLVAMTGLAHPPRTYSHHVQARPASCSTLGRRATPPAKVQTPPASQRREKGQSSRKKKGLGVVAGSCVLVNDLLNKMPFCF